MSKAKVAHKAVLLVNIEVHDVLATGECSGNVVPLDKLKEYGLDGSMLASVDGYDLDNCLKKLKKKLGDLDG